MDEDIWLEFKDLKITEKQIPILLDRFNLLPNLIRSVIENKSIEDITPTDKEQLDFQFNFLSNAGIKNKESLEIWLSKNGLDEKRLSILLYDQLKIEKFKEEKFSANVESSFLNQKSSLDRVLYSLIRVKSKIEAEELFLKLEEEEASFANLASKYSQGVEKEFNGVIGPMEIGKLNPELAERLRISKDGQLWPPFETNNWWIILRHEKSIPAKLDNNMRNNLLSDLYEKWMQSQLIPILKNIREKNNQFEKENNEAKSINKKEKVFKNKKQVSLNPLSILNRFKNDK
tara:strand:+ start:732 stop:1595 length:864 start_codon:yes stop_codon:yes gene_type:complete